jgi:predicted lipid-binding transport protein (Tim44 family)
MTALATAVVALAGCATVPAGPAAPAIPGTRATGEQFARDDAACRAQAQAAFAPNAAQPANDAAAANVVGGAVIGAAIGALIGAAFGDAGAGAAIGAGTGALGGGTVAADISGRSNVEMQAVYDRVYFQCMYARGHRVPSGAVAQRQRYYEVPQSAAPAVGYPPAGTPPPARGYGPPSTQPPAGGFPPANAPPPGK